MAKSRSAGKQAQAEAEQKRMASKSSPSVPSTMDRGTRSTGAALGAEGYVCDCVRDGCLNIVYGKDRYPYPVGYQVVRAHNGITYKMEIREGVNGPKFLISSDDGSSYSGKTPDFVWEEFQKKGCSRMKIWHGKRLSSKMDGLEAIMLTLDS
ncbi:FY-rich, C-terminal [Sesbania bispinosa]|nr:FY-rich, C-terminal [Sesbania bispinosa]